METLTEIHSTKNLIRPPYYCDKEIFPHNYLSKIYDVYLPEYKNKPVNLLEIGVQHGGSLWLWKEYFQQGIIYGIDVKDVRAEDTKIINNILFILGDAYSDNIVSRLPKFDIIIDDASHRLDHQKYTIESYKKLLKEDGIMIIEDIGSSDFLDQLADLATQVGYKTVIKHNMSEEMKRWDNIVLVLKP